MCSRIDRASDSGPAKHLITVADKRIRWLHHIRIQCCTNGQRFYRRSRFKSIADAIIFPDTVKLLQHRIIIHPIDLILRIMGSKISWIVQIIRVIRRHGKNLTIFRIRNNDTYICRSFGPSRTICHTIHKIADIFFYYLLNIKING